jgi:5-formyltetrahydrofolate cyclo-ligase
LSLLAGNGVNAYHRIMDKAGTRRRMKAVLAEIPAADLARRSWLAAARLLIADGELSFRVIAGDPDRLARDAWAIPQPDPAWPAWVPEARPAHVLVVTPGMAFDAGMHRLGRGMGYYDRFLARLRAASGIRCTAVAFCMDEQVVDRLPHDPGDQPVDAIVTDRRTICGAP